jgi:hypothetical protein
MGIFRFIRGGHWFSKISAVSPVFPWFKPPLCEKDDKSPALLQIGAKGGLVEGSVIQRLWEGSGGTNPGPVHSVIGTGLSYSPM